VKTEIELQNNQSFAIAGLLDNRVTENLSKVPGLGDVPLLGKLFQSQALNRNHSELLVVVTPEMVRAITATSNIPTVAMPKKFMDAAEPVSDRANPASDQQLPVLRQVPFQPTEKKSAAPAAEPDLTPSGPGLLKDMMESLKKR
jgi:pilus assembly protein CpaC